MTTSTTATAAKQAPDINPVANDSAKKTATQSPSGFAQVGNTLESAAQKETPKATEVKTTYFTNLSDKIRALLKALKDFIINGIFGCFCKKSEGKAPTNGDVASVTTDSQQDTPAPRKPVEGSESTK